MSSLLRFQKVAFPAMLQIRAFHVSPCVNIKVGDSLPGVEVMEDSPGNKISLARELDGRNGLILGVPGAFSPACSEKQIQAYVNADPKTPIYVIAVNDPFVTKAWRESLLSGKPHHAFRFLADSTAAFSNALDMTFDATSIFGGIRSRRYALVLQDGKVAKMFVEPDKTGVTVTSAENVLKEL